MRQWQLQDAKNRLSQVLREAQTEGPQVITQHGREAGVLMSMEAYRALTTPRTSLYDFFRSSPLVGVDLDLERSTEAPPVLEL